MASPLRCRMQEEDKFWGKDNEFVSGCVGHGPRVEISRGHLILWSGAEEGVWVIAIDGLRSGCITRQCSEERRPRPGTWDTLTVKRHQGCWTGVGILEATKREASEEMVGRIILSISA